MQIEKGEKNKNCLQSQAFSFRLFWDVYIILDWNDLLQNKLEQKISHFPWTYRLGMMFHSTKIFWTSLGKIMCHEMSVSFFFSFPINFDNKLENFAIPIIIYYHYISLSGYLEMLIYYCTELIRVKIYWKRKKIILAFQYFLDNIVF